MARSRSSRRWLREHFDDPYTRRAHAEGYRGRAAYKLAELDEKYGLLRPGMRVVDLGAAPGAWSQYAAGRLGDAGTVIASDVLAMDPLPGVEFVQGDFHDPEVLERLLAALGEARADLVMSDMAPNMSGMEAVDQPASMALAELAHDLAVRVLKPGGALLAKMFQGEGSDAFVQSLRADFDSVRVRKPRASRDRSREVYVLATGRKL
ncbi:MAG: 23S rRNA (uridine(2552)-2'-O)-methyltransferase RlmE [Halofilum sp. (in: g-proteobacteria)]|nr:23S rRNA (uridine(2552)-2'-O)-methyltransferase RlmE [Halofilum sp. (in: g-proteobacteria)]